MAALNTYKVFETLNARGGRLSATDLLKNWLFSVLARGQTPQTGLMELERRWESMVGRFGSENFSDFLRMHWNSRNGFASQAELFKTVRARIQQPADVFALLSAMDEDIDSYLALTEPAGSQQAGGVEFDAESSSYSIEHVLPQSPASEWDQSDDRDLEHSIYRLDNMVMLATAATTGQDGDFDLAGGAPFLGTREAANGVFTSLTPFVMSTAGGDHRRGSHLLSKKRSMWNVTSLDRRDIRRSFWLT